MPIEKLATLCVDTVLPFLWTWFGLGLLIGLISGALGMLIYLVNRN